MSSTPPPPTPPPGPDKGRPEGGFASQAAKSFQVQTKSIAQEFYERLIDAMPHLKAFNASVAAWVTQASWTRLGLLGFVVLIASLIIGNILGVDDSIVVDGGPPPKNVTIEVHDDAKGVSIVPMIDGKKGKVVTVPMPPAPPPPTLPESGAAASVPGAPGTPGAPGKLAADDNGLHFEKDGKRITIDDHGVHVEDTRAPSAASALDAQAKSAQAAVDAAQSAGAESDAARDKLEALKARADALKDRAEEEAERQKEFQSDVESAIADAKDELQDSIAESVRANQKVTVKRRESVALWGFFKVLLTLAFAYLVAIKVSSTTKRRADAMVKSAAEVAEQEGLQRQLLEARLQTMQAQVEPHFLFNTLASVDYLIETDPARASTMQKNLIQYLRSAMPQMRGAATQLGREVDLVRAYLEILKVRMEERLQVVIAVSDGLRSADFPPMMLQSLVENAIKHGLEPKAEGGSLAVTAEIFDGNLHVTVADTGLGFAAGGAPTSGGGIGLSNIRERLALLYGGKARIEIAPNVPAGTRVSIIVPYQPVVMKAAQPFAAGEKKEPT